MGGSKFSNLFDFISGIIICILFSFYFLLLSQSTAIQIIRTKIGLWCQKKNILYKDINTLILTLSTTPRGIYNIGLTEPYFYTKKKGRKEYISNITVYINEVKNIKEQYDKKITNGNLKSTPSYSFNCHDKLSIYHLIKESNSDVYVTSIE